MIKNKLTVICEDEEIRAFNIQAVADLAYAELGQSESLCIELTLVTEEEIKEINKEQRGIDSVTDVLSFPYLDGIRGEVVTEAHFMGEDPEEEGYLLGSVCICLKRAEEQAIEYGHSIEREVCFLILHGILHCFGYDHMTESDEAEMMGIAEKIMEKLNLKRN